MRKTILAIVAFSILIVFISVLKIALCYLFGELETEYFIFDLKTYITLYLLVYLTIK